MDGAEAEVLAEEAAASVGAAAAVSEAEVLQEDGKEFGIKPSSSIMMD